ncbi:MAG: outer membrane protein [Oleispira sp.]|jgi:outer membrane protein
MKKLLAVAIVAATPMMAQADLLFTAKAGASSWNAEATGDIDGDVDVGKEGLNLDSENNNVLFAAFEHPLPLIPNIKVMKTDLDLTGEGRASFNFLGQSFNENTTSQFDLSHTDLTLYWGVPLPIPYLDINFGLTARQFDGLVSVKGDTTGSEETADLDFTLPMGYLNVDLDTPFGIYARADLNAVSYGGNGISDMAVAVGYTLPIPFIDINLEAGHRVISVKTDEDTTDVETDIEVAGMFFGLNVSVGL